MAIVLRENFVSNFKDFTILKKISFRLVLLFFKLNVSKPPSLGKSYCEWNSSKVLELRIRIVAVSHGNPGIENMITNMSLVMCTHIVFYVRQRTCSHTVVLEKYEWVTKAHRRKLTFPKAHFQIMTFSDENFNQSKLLHCDRWFSLFAFIYIFIFKN